MTATGTKISSSVNSLFTNLESNYLVVILNLSVKFSPELIQSVLFYLRSFLISKYENQLDIFINFNGQVCKKIYSTCSKFDCKSDEDFGIKSFLNELKDKSLNTWNPSYLSYALSMILCENNSRKLPYPLKTSILIINENFLVPSSQYVHFMNSLFEAQRNGIKCNVINVESDNFEGDNVLLKQAASITSGYYIKIDSPSEIVTVLLNFPPELSSSAQAVLNRPKQEIVDFRGSCFCHGKVVDLGFVCSVCLSGKKRKFIIFKINLLFNFLVFCSFSPFCKVCKTKFNFSQVNK